MGIRFDNADPAQPSAARQDPRGPIAVRAGASASSEARAKDKVTPAFGVDLPIPAAARGSGPIHKDVRKTGERGSFAVEEDAERTEIARMPPSFYYDSAKDEPTRSRDAMPDAALLEDLDDITSPRAEVPPTGRPAPGRPPQPAQPPQRAAIDWQPPAASAPPPVLRGSGNSTPNRVSPTASGLPIEPPTPLGFGVGRQPGGQPVSQPSPPWAGGHTPSISDLAPTRPLPRPSALLEARPIGLGEAPTPRPDQVPGFPSFDSQPTAVDPAGLHTPAWPMPAPDPEGSARRGGTAKIWLGLAVVAIAAVVGGLWIVKPKTEPAPVATAPAEPAPAEPAAGAAAPGTPPAAAPASPPVAAPGTEPAAGSPPAPAAAGQPPPPAQAAAPTETPGSAPAATPPAEAPPAASPPAAAVATNEPAAPASAKPAARPPRKVRNIGPPRRPAEPEETAPVVASETSPTTAPGAEPSAAPGSPGIPTPAESAEDVFWLHVRSTPAGADVLIDGQVEGKTPFDRRIFDPNRTYALTIRKPGFEPMERLLGATDAWVKKGNTRRLTVSARLAPASATIPPQAPPSEARPAEPTAPGSSPATPPAAPPERKANPFDEPAPGAQPSP